MRFSNPLVKSTASQSHFLHHLHDTHLFRGMPLYIDDSALKKFPVHIPRRLPRNSKSKVLLPPYLKAFTMIAFPIHTAYLKHLIPTSTY